MLETKGAHLGPVNPWQDDAERSSLAALGTTTVLGYGLLFAVAFLATTRCFIPPHPEDEILRAKLDHLTRHADDYDGVFLGSSRIHRGFVPAEFERSTRAAGRPLRIFNFGLLYGRPHELDTLLRELLDRHRFRYVFIEVMDWSPSINGDLADQERTIRWHTAGQTVSAIRTTWVSSSPLLQKGLRTLEHAGHFLKRSVNFGGGVPWLASWFDDGTRHAVWQRVVADGDGFVPYERESDPMYEKEHREFVEQLVPDYLREIAEIDSANGEAGSLDGFNVRAQSEQQALVRNAGAIPIFVIPNVRVGTPDWHRLDDEGVVDHLVTLNHVAAFPELYAVENRFDRRHLNTAGAIAFTQALFNELRDNGPLRR